MLVVKRRVGDSIAIGDDVTVTVLEVNDDYARIGIQAPRSVAVHRAEVLTEVEETNRAAASPSAEAIAALTRRLGARPPAH